MKNRVHIEPAGLGAEERQTSAEGSAAFTPGPWDLHTYSDGSFSIDPRGFGLNGGFVIVGVAAMSGPHAPANARLIAAAPELYGSLDPLALEFAADCLERLRAAPRVVERLRALAQEQRAAIAKAAPAHASRSDVTASEGEVSPGTNS